MVRGEVAAASDGIRYMYVMAGHGEKWEGNLRSLVRYDSVTDSWTFLAEQNVVEAVNHVMVHYMDVDGPKIYQIGGFQPEISDVAIYDIATDTWLTGTPLTLDGQRYSLASAASAVIDGKIYVTGGIHNRNQDGYNPSHTLVYDPLDGPGGNWTQLADMPGDLARNHAAGCGYNGKFYVFAGRRGPNSSRNAPIKESLVYDPAADTWTQIADIPFPRAGSVNAVELNGEIYVIGGENPGTVEDNSSAYNPVTNSWTTKEPMQVARHGTYPVKIGNAIHIAGGGGETGWSASNWHEAYYPETPTAIIIDAGASDEDTSVIFGSWTWVYSTNRAIAGAGVYGKDVFQTHRSGKSTFMYIFDGFAPDSAWNITLGFAETWRPNCEVGQRVMDITVNGQEFISNLDVFAVAGCETALVEMKSFTADADGQFQIAFTAIVQNTMVSLIGISKS